MAGNVVRALQLVIDARRAKEGSREWSSAVKEVETGARGAAGANDRLEKGIKSTGETAAASSGGLLKLSAALGGIAGAGVSIGKIANFDSLIKQIAVAGGLGAEEIGSLRKEVIALGAEGLGPQAVADGILGLVKAGVDASQAISAINPVLNLARAGMISVSDATDLAVASTSQFGLGIAGASRVADVFVTTADSTIASVELLGAGMRVLGPIAALLSIPLEDAAAAMGTLAQQGIQGSKAGTGIAGALAALLSPSTQARAVLDGLGITVEKLDIKTRGLQEVFREFRGVGFEDLVKIFGRESTPEAAALIAGIDGSFESLVGRLKETQGQAKKTAEAVTDNLKGAIDGLKGSIEAAVITAGESGFTGALKEIVDTGSAAVRILSGLDAGTRGNETAARLLIASVEALTVRYVALFALNGAAKIASLTQAMLTAKATTDVFGIATVATTTRMGALFALMRANPIGLIATGLGVAIGAMSLFGDEAEEAARKLEEVAKQNKSFAGLAGGIASSSGLDERIAKIRELQAALKDVERADFFDANLRDALTGSRLADLNVFKQERFNEQEGQYRRDAALRSSDIIGLLEEEVRAIDRKKAALVAQAEAAKLAAEADKRRQAAAKESLLYDVKAIGVSAFGLASGTATEFGDGFSALYQGVVSRTEAIANSLQIQLDASRGLNDYIAGLERERDLLRLSTDERERASAVLQAEDILRASGQKLTNQQADSIRGLISEQQQLRAAEEASAESTRLAAEAAEEAKRTREEEAEKIAQSRLRIGELTDDLRFEISIINLSNQEREKAIALRRLEQEAAGLSADEIARSSEEYRRLLDELQRLEEVKELADSAGNSIAQGLARGIEQGAGFSTTLGNIIQQLQGIALQSFFTEPLGNFLSGIAGSLIPSANGNVFQGGRLIPFAGGGIFSGPTYFPMAGGNVGLAGEAGEEAIIPLDRKNGRLGLKGGGNSVTVNMTVYAQDAGSFRRSRGQIESDLQGIASSYHR